MRWIRSAGGPLILLGEFHLAEWHGVLRSTLATGDTTLPSAGESRSDYERACEVDAYVGQIRVGSSNALVLGGEPMDTGWIASPRLTGGMIVRWLFGDNEDEILQHVEKVSESMFRLDGHFSFEGNKAVLFDSALAGRNVSRFPDECLVIELGAGVYSVSTAVCRPENKMYAVIHRFSPMSVAEEARA
ncbi:MAG: Imm21 family immunity protein [Singulisphaera sp.]